MIGLIYAVGVKRRIGPIETKLPPREIDINLRLKEAREALGIAQVKFAEVVGITKDRLSSYEQNRAPLKCDLALRICRHWIISEEWLATGKFEAVKSVAPRHGLSDVDGLPEIFRRQAMDLLSEPIVHQIPPGTLFSDAYDKFLRARYAALIDEFFFTPRIVLSDADTPPLMLNLMRVLTERWLMMIGSEAVRIGKTESLAQRSFVRTIYEANDFLFRRHMGYKDRPEALKKLDWLRQALNFYDMPIGELHAGDSPKLPREESKHSSPNAHRKLAERSKGE